MVQFIVLLWCFICVIKIQIGKVNLISQISQIMTINMLKNRSHRYSNHYIIKFVVFMTIYYAINLNIGVLDGNNFFFKKIIKLVWKPK